LPIPRRGKPSRPSSDILPFPAGGPVPHEIQSAQAKDRIADVVKKAAAGGRTTIISRGYAIAIVGPAEDIPPKLLSDAVRLPTTEIKSGQTSLKGMLARHDYALLTVHGEARAAVYRPKLRTLSETGESKLDRLIALLDATGAVAQQNQSALETATRLERFIAELHAQIEEAFDLLDQAKPGAAPPLRARFAELRRKLARAKDAAL
jgi:antitoxin (DNA-binding transcriptional repressor) of toxin-antitoxin stability system